MAQSVADVRRASALESVKGCKACARRPGRPCASSPILRVRRATLCDLVNGKAVLSPGMALRIEKAFGVSMDTLLRMQAWHDSHAMRQLIWIDVEG
jgi:addiction module HigA family antidote